MLKNFSRFFSNSRMLYSMYGPFFHRLFFFFYLFYFGNEIRHATSPIPCFELLLFSLPFLVYLFCTFGNFTSSQLFFLSFSGSVFFLVELLCCWFVFPFWGIFPFSDTSFNFFYVFSDTISPIFSYHAVFSGESLVLLVLTALILPVVVVSIGKDKSTQRLGELYGYFFLITALLVLVFTQYNLLLFYVFFERTLPPMFIVIGGWGSRPEREGAADRFFLFTVACSVPFLLSLLFLQTTFGTLDRNDLLIALPSFPLPAFVGEILVFSFFLCFSVKLPLFPFHTWLPEAHVEAPTSGSMFLAGILLKMGGYAIYRFLVPLFSYYFYEDVSVQVFFEMLCVLSIVYGRQGALAQTDLKKVVAYSSVSHMGFCSLGFFPFSSPTLGNAGSFVLMFRHGLVSAALFFLVGDLYSRYGTRNILSFSGLVSIHPVLSFYMFFFAFSNVGFPGTPRYPAEIFIVSSLSPLFSTTLLSALASLLGAFYTFFSFFRILWGPVSAPPAQPGFSTFDEERVDVSLFDSLCLQLFLFFPSLSLGLFPAPLFILLGTSFLGLAAFSVKL